MDRNNQSHTYLRRATLLLLWLSLMLSNHQLVFSLSLSHIHAYTNAPKTDPGRRKSLQFSLWWLVLPVTKISTGLTFHAFIPQLYFCDFFYSSRLLLMFVLAWFLQKIHWRVDRKTPGWSAFSPQPLDLLLCYLQEHLTGGPVFMPGKELIYICWLSSMT